MVPFEAALKYLQDAIDILDAGELDMETIGFRVTTLDMIGRIKREMNEDGKVTSGEVESETIGNGTSDKTIEDNVKTIAEYGSCQLEIT